MFDRDVEWTALAAFAGDDGPGATLGVVSGRRRQGKTFLLRALCEATGGFYFAADEATDGESLHQFGSAIGSYLGLPSALRLSDWHGGCWPSAKSSGTSPWTCRTSTGCATSAGC